MTPLLGMSVFVRTVETGSFSAAAAQLGLSPQMAGRHIKSIEERFGSRLLNRSTRNQSLTEVGRLYYEQCKRALAEVETAEAILSAHSNAPRGKLRLASPVSFATNHLAPLLTRFLREFPDIQVDLTVTETLVDVVDGGYDAAFWVGALPDSALQVRTLAPYRRMVVAAPEYLLGKSAPGCPDDLRQHDCLAGSVAPHGPSFVWQLEREGVSYDVPIKGRLRIDDERVLVEAALSGAGVFLGCRSLLREHVRDGRLVRLLPEYEVKPLPIHVLFPGQSHMPKKVRRFIDWIVVESKERSRRAQLADAA